MDAVLHVGPLAPSFVHAKSVCAVAFWVTAQPKSASSGPVLGAINTKINGWGVEPVAAIAAGTFTTPRLPRGSAIVATPVTVAAPSCELNAQTPGGWAIVPRIPPRNRAAAIIHIFTHRLLKV